MALNDQDINDVVRDIMGSKSETYSLGNCTSCIRSGQIGYYCVYCIGNHSFKFTPDGQLVQNHAEMIKLIINNNNIPIKAEKLEEILGARVDDRDNKTLIDMMGIHTRKKLDERMNDPPNVRATEATVNEWKARRRTDSLMQMNRLRIFMYKNHGTLTEDGERVLSAVEDYSAEE